MRKHYRLMIPGPIEVEPEVLARMSDPLLRLAIPADARAIAHIHLGARRQAMPYLPVLHSDDEVRVWMRSTLIVQAEVWVAEVAALLAGRARRVLLRQTGEIGAQTKLPPNAFRACRSTNQGS